MDLQCDQITDYKYLLFLDPSDGVFGRFDLAALCGCRTLNFCLFCLFDSESETDLPGTSSDEELVEV